ncbi:hypothetical protein N780_10225 [Pontibacillus chungwhensis BH030062]|uniref:GIY-YIG domain-containing protein n=1 Tax=Pontibacillus chungwhensis BH030062 TaxID=1385513 RepID=A0A0A2UNZ2_9BACI|nr:hypothetical protein [Pontibacillus chungwhensis]KGP89664.1 hypothetical protein N780_10225 [Pontibacillus chungwhensis BH030062]
MSFEYENQEHYLNFARKILKTNGLFIAKIDPFLAPVCKDLYQFSIRYEKTLNRLHFRLPYDVFTFYLRDVFSIDEFKELVRVFRQHRIDLNEIVNEVNPDFDYYERLYEVFYKPSDVSKLIQLQDESLDSTGFTESFKEMCEQQEYQKGLYFLYNRKSELIYIGKSTQNLGARVVTSSIERKGAYFASFAFPATKSDVHVYELYYISKLKPEHNAEGKEKDELTINLPELEESAMINIWKKES